MVQVHSQINKIVQQNGNRRIKLLTHPSVGHQWAPTPDCQLNFDFRISPCPMVVQTPAVMHHLRCSIHRKFSSISFRMGFFFRKHIRVRLTVFISNDLLATLAESTGSHDLIVTEWCTNWSRYLYSASSDHRSQRSGWSTIYRCCQTQCGHNDQYAQYTWSHHFCFIRLRCFFGKFKLFVV